jgi:hypothetical protein
MSDILDDDCDSEEIDWHGAPVPPPGVPEVPVICEMTETYQELSFRCPHCDQVHYLATPHGGYGLQDSNCGQGEYFLRDPLAGEVVDLTSYRSVKTVPYDAVRNPAGFNTAELAEIAKREKARRIEAFVEDYREWLIDPIGPEPPGAEAAKDQIKWQSYLWRCSIGDHDAAYESVFGEQDEEAQEDARIRNYYINERGFPADVINRAILPENATKLELERQEYANHVLDTLLEKDKVEQQAIETGMELGKLLSIHAWVERDITPLDRLLGDLLTTTSRTFLVGRTGTGKTMLGLQIACHIAAGVDFLHWRAHRPARVLYIDGEMPAELIRSRSIDALRRLGMDAHVPPSNLWILGRDSEEELGKRFTGLGPLPPLNTTDGHKYINRLVNLCHFDLVIFDNVMSLVTGDVKEETTWSGCLPLVQHLTNQKVGQLWFDHTGHDATRQYGSSTKAWRFDSVGIMTPHDGNGDELVFTLSFDHPGKSRRRTPDNWRDFQDVQISLIDDEWTFEPVVRKASKASQGESARVKPKIGKDATILFNTINECRSEWRSLPEGSEFPKSGLGMPRQAVRDKFYRKMDPETSADTKRGLFRRAWVDLLAAKLIGLDGNWIWLIAAE